MSEKCSLQLSEYSKVRQLRRQALVAYRKGDYASAAHLCRCAVAEETRGSESSICVLSAAEMKLRFFRCAAHNARKASIFDATAIPKSFVTEGYCEEKLLEWVPAAHAYLNAVGERPSSTKLQVNFNSMVQEVFWDRYGPQYRLPPASLEVYPREWPEEEPAPKEKKVEVKTRTLWDDFADNFNKIYMKDLLGRDESKHEMITDQIRDHLWKHYVPLRKMFRYYARLNTTATMGVERDNVLADSTFTVDKREFLTFLDHCSLPNKTTLTPAVINIIFIIANRDRDADGNPVGDAENSSACLVLYEFMGCVIRMAHAKYQNIPDLPTRLAHMLEVDIIPNAMTDLSYTFRERLKDAAVKAVLQRQQSLIDSLFLAYSKRDVRDIIRKGSTRVTSMNIRELLLLMEEYAMLDERLTLKEVQDSFVQSQFDPTSFNLNDVSKLEDVADNDVSEMDKDEFVEALARCAAAKFPDSMLLTDDGKAVQVSLHVKLDALLHLLSARPPKGKVIDNALRTDRSLLDSLARSGDIDVSLIRPPERASGDAPASSPGPSRRGTVVAAAISTSPSAQSRANDPPTGRPEASSPEPDVVERFSYGGIDDGGPSSSNPSMSENTLRRFVLPTPLTVPSASPSPLASPQVHRVGLTPTLRDTLSAWGSEDVQLKHGAGTARQAAAAKPKPSYARPTSAPRRLLMSVTSASTTTTTTSTPRPQSARATRPPPSPSRPHSAHGRLQTDLFPAASTPTPPPHPPSRPPSGRPQPNRRPPSPRLSNATSASPQMLVSSPSQTPLPPPGQKSVRFLVLDADGH